MNSTIHLAGPASQLSAETEHQEDWSDIWALEDPAISGADPSDHDPADRSDYSAEP